MKVRFYPEDWMWPACLSIRWRGRTVVIFLDGWPRLVRLY